LELIFNAFCLTSQLFLSSVFIFSISPCFVKNYFFEFIRQLDKPSFDQANLTVLYHHFKKKVDNKIAPELKSF